MAPWKIFPDPTENRVEYTPFLQSRKFFAVDDSGSTAGPVIKRERAFVEHLRENFANPDDSISLWGTHCDPPTKDFRSLRWESDHQSTWAAQILENIHIQDAIQRSDVWFLLTDGEIYDNQHHKLPEVAHELDVLKVPIVSLIVGSRGRTPDTSNLSVGISFFASSQNSLILFKETETGRIFVVAGKGCFAPLGGSTAAQALTTWRDIPVFRSEGEFFQHCESLDVQVPKAESRVNFPTGVMSLGPHWEMTHGAPVWVDIDKLMKAGVLSDNDVNQLFTEEAFNILALDCRARKQIPQFRIFVQAQKIEQVTPKLEDVSGAAIIISRMGHPETTEEEQKALQERLREAHAKNRDHYQKAVAEFTGSHKAKSLRKRNQRVDAVLREWASIEDKNFSGDFLSRRSNRARLAEVVEFNSTNARSNLDLQGPSYKGSCIICYGEQEVMSICLKELDSENKYDNTTDFALNFPLAAGSSTKNVNIVCSQNVCFQCALLEPRGMSIYKEKLKAIIPVIHYVGSNKEYINNQLYLALTARLETGAAELAQLFMAVLEEILKTRPWAGAGLGESQISEDEQQVVQTRQTFRWMLDQLLQNTRTCETFTEVGDWVTFPEALSWAARDFETNGLASFAMTYPTAGFPKILSFGHKTGVFSDKVVRQMKIAKDVYSIVESYLANMQSALQSPEPGNDWKQKYLETIYQDFNATLVPKDRGSQSIVTDTEMFLTRFSACLGQGQTQSTECISPEELQKMMGKVQVLLFWLIYRQKSHCTAQAFFTKISLEEHLAMAALDPSLSVPKGELDAALLSIFAAQDAQLIDPNAAALHDALVPFKTPFGPSVLRCGVGACNESFFEADKPELALRNIEAIRRARTQHLIRVFGIRGRFEHASTGLPAKAAAGKPPSSIHTNLHIGVSRTWAEQSREKRRVILDDEDEREGFVTKVRKRICKQGRGNVFQQNIDEDVRNVLPSFFAVLGQALRMEGRSDGDITVYEHDFEMNKVEAKIRYELAAMGTGGVWDEVGLF